MSRRDARQTEALRLWAHVAWVGAVCVGVGAQAIAASFGAGGVAGVMAAALIAPALTLSRPDLIASDGWRIVFLTAWCAPGVAACALAGTLDTAASAAFIAPFGVVVLSGRGRALGEAAVLCAAGLVATAAFTAARGGATPVDMAALGPALAVGAFAFVGIGLGARLARSEADAKEAADVRADAKRTLDAAPDLYLLVTAGGRIEQAFGAGGPKLGVLRMGLEGGNVADLVAPHDVEALTRVVVSAAQFGDETRTPVRMGGHMAVAVARPLGRGRAVLALRPMDEAAQSSSAGQAEVMAGVVHDLRTPLNAILGFADAMREEIFGPLASKYREYAGLICDGAEHMRDLVGDVLDLAKLETGRWPYDPERMDAREVIETAVSITRPGAERKGVVLSVDASCATAPVDADRRALRQILLNLVSNAVKFTPQGGRVAVSALTDDADLVIAVRDEGPGMDPATIKSLGQRFQQAKAGKESAERGSGLGLSIVRALAELHDGRLEAESVLGEGATVRVRLPVVAIDVDAGPGRMDARARLERVREALVATR